MAELTAKESVQQACQIACAALRPVLELNPPPVERGTSWPAAYEQEGRAQGWPARTYSLDDPRFVLLVVARDWMHVAGMQPAHAGLAQQARTVFNKSARGEAVDNVDVASAAHSLSALLDDLGLLDPATRVRELAGPMRTDLDPTRTAEGAVEPGADEPPTTSLSPTHAGPAVQDLEDGMRAVSVRVGQVEVEVRYVPALSYAMAFNGISPVRDVVVRNQDSEEHELKSVTIDLPGLRSSLPLTFGEPVPPDVTLTVEHSALSWQLDHALFATFEENVPTTLHVLARVDDAEASTSASVTLLTHDRWDRRFLPELLAAFVTPTSPDVAELAQAASEAVAAATGDAGLNGYQGGPERALRMSRACYDVLFARRQPHDTDEAQGECPRIRRGVLGGQEPLTSLETGVAFAALAEHCGLHPLLGVAGDRVVCGILLDDVALPSLTMASPDELATLAGSGLLEAFLVQPGSSYEASQREADRFFSVDAGDVDFLLDVSAARRRVKPLPRIEMGAEGLVVHVEREPSRPIAKPLTNRVAPGSPDDQYPPRVQRWRRSLLDLSLRNPLLKLKGGSGLSLAIPEASIAEVEDHLASGMSFTIADGRDLPEIYTARGIASATSLPASDLADVIAREHVIYATATRGAVPTRLDALRRKAATAVEETGANALFLTLGALKFTDAKGSEGLAPLYLLPVRLTGRKGSRYSIQAADDALALPNYCLIEKLRRDHGLEIPVLATPPQDDSGIDIAAIFQAVRHDVLVSGRDFSVVPEFRLAQLEFATLEMWRDLSEHWEDFLANPVVKHLVQTPLDPFDDPVAEPELAPDDEATAHLPVPSDGAQLKAVRWAREGRTFVLQGPPGTGKSQTITNIIADAMAAGRTVLFVAEKQAALQVVQRRLEGVGLGPLTLELHGRKQTIRDARRQLAAAWEAAESPGLSDYDMAREAHRSAVRRLADYPALLDGPGPAGMSLRQAYLRHHELRRGAPERMDIPPVPPVVANGTVPLRAVRDAAAAVESSQERLGHPVTKSIWALAGPARSDVTTEEIYRAITRLSRAQWALSTPVQNLLARSDREVWERVVTWLGLVADGAGTLDDEERGPDGSGRTLAGRIDEAQRRLQSYRDRHGWLLTHLHPAALRVDPSALRQGLAQARATTSFLGRRAKAVAAAESEVRRLFLSPDLLASERIDAFLNDLEVYQDETRRLGEHLSTVLPSTDADPTEGRAELQLTATRARIDQWQRMRSLIGDVALGDSYLEAVRSGASDPRQDVRAVSEFVEAWASLLDVLGSTSYTVSQWRAGRGELQAVQDDLPAWAEAAGSSRLGGLARLQQARADLSALADLGMEGLARSIELGERSADNLPRRIELAVAKVALDERLDSTGLDRFAHQKRQRHIQGLLQASKQMRVAAKTGLPQTVRRQRRLDVTHPDSAMAGLRREFQRARGGTIRELVANHGDALLRLTPCLLMSPQSVARFIPVGSVTFDLVIFDEASQIRVADAVGALGRSRGAVIVGDSMQMPPTSTFSTAAEEDDDAVDGFLVPADQESILTEAADSNIVQVPLTWHYRSKDERLIAFSNSAYYGGRLASFPSPPGITSPAGLELVHVGGTFESGASRVNRAEADAIVGELTRMLRRDPQASVGVITFNLQQRNLLLDLLESGDRVVQQALAREHEPLFVKNLENVQGDERDTILFSLAYAPNPETGRLALNFGPLTAEGGEKRLNVAITRARERVRIFASFRPADIDLSRTGSKALRDLREYMQFAEAGTEPTAVSRRDKDAYRALVAEALTSSGLEVQEAVGLSSFKVDLAVRLPGSPGWAAVLLDSPAWALRRTVGDRETLPATVLQDAMGWPALERVWLPEWLRDEQSVVDRVRAAAEAADREVRERLQKSQEREETVATGEGERPPMSETAGAPGAWATPLDLPRPGEAAGEPEAEEPEVEPSEGEGPVGHVEHAPARDVQDQVALPGEGDPGAEPPAGDVEVVGGITVAAFRAAEDLTGGPRSVLDDLQDRENRMRVLATVDALVAAEGPMEKQRLASAVARAYGLAVARSERADAIIGVVPRSRVTRDGHSRTQFVWPEGLTPETYDRVLVNDPTTERGRAVGQITDVEIVNAARVALHRHGSSMTMEDLAYATKDVLGFTRLGSKVRDRLRFALEQGLASGALRTVGDQVSLP